MNRTEHADARPDTPPVTSPDGREPTPSDLERELRLARATDLARTGRPGEAEALLAGAPDPTSAELDLRARIAAQRGDLAAADELWVRAAEASGGRETYAAQHAKISERRKRRVGARTWRRIGAALLALLLVVLLATTAAWQLRRADAGDRELAGLRAQQEETARQLEESRARPQQAPSLPDGVGPALAVPGVDVVGNGDRVTVRFRQAVFSGGSTEPGQAARAALTDLGRRLAALGPDVRVRVIGHTAPSAEPARIDGGELGLRRAAAAAAAITDGGMAPASLSVLSAGSSDPPFPGDTAEDTTARNRTVTVEVVPAR